MRTPNLNYNHIRGALRLTRDHVFEIMQGQVSRSEIDGWGRSPDSDKFRAMSGDQFNIFCQNLYIVFRED